MYLTFAFCVKNIHVSTHNNKTFILTFKSYSHLTEKTNYGTFKILWIAILSAFKHFFFLSERLIQVILKYASNSPKFKRKTHKQLNFNICPLENKAWNIEPVAKNKPSPYLTKSYLTQDKNETNRMVVHKQNTLQTLPWYISEVNT